VYIDPTSWHEIGYFFCFALGLLGVLHFLNFFGASEFFWEYE